MKIEYYTKTNYGAIMEYIRDKEKAQIFQELTNKKTISAKDRLLWEKLGIHFKEVLAPKPYEKII